ncbi:MAG: hypothetical protein B6D37_11640 [Sphingobacteriales bacterium UTBCD1]|nr:MAG: hypothetical protein B6D37_11640 [Sphingobacteriales bacterium UTBCD1]
MFWNRIASWDKLFLQIMKNCFVFVLPVFFCSVLYAQSRPGYPKYYFRNPLNIPMDLTANMGELRPDHWHMGLDIRTQRKEDLPVYAAAGGYIAKVKIEPFGYGRSIFIKHPNGMTTVYGHLNSFFSALEKYVTEQQYQQQSWEIELDFSKERFPVFKSELIAYSGNSGGSMGPHLHFEIRDTKTGKCLNPLLFGFPIKDELPPEINKLALYDRTISVYRQEPQLFSLKKNAGDDYLLSTVPVIQTGLNRVSFAIQALDKMKNSGSPDGIYSAKIFFDNKPVLGFILDSINYGESSYVNAQIDYKYYYKTGKYLQHLSLLPGDPGVVYKKISGDGIFNLSDTGFHLVHIEVRDEYNHRSQLNFMIGHVDSLQKPSVRDTLNVFAPNQVNVFKKEDFEFLLPKYSLYDTVNVVYYRNDSPAPNAVSALHRLNDPSLPLHVAATVKIKPVRELPDSIKNKVVIICNDGRRNIVRKAEWQEGWMTARFGDFGSYRAFIDTVPPYIKDIGKEDTVVYASSNSIVVEARDDLGAVTNFRGEIDGRWVCFTNDKKGPFIYTFDEHCPYGVHQLKVTVEDIAGNTTAKTWWIRRDLFTPSPRKVIHKKKGVPIKKTAVKKSTKTK